MSNSPKKLKRIFQFSRPEKKANPVRKRGASKPAFRNKEKALYSSQSQGVELSNGVKKPEKKTGGRKFPSLKQWKRFLRVLNKKEKNIFFLLMVLALSSASILGVNFYFRNTKVVPAFEGEYKEGIVGQPMSLNPLRLANQDVDRDLVEVLFSGLLKYDENGNLVQDLAESYKIQEEGKVVEVYLKKDVFWHDRKPLTIDDVMFTLNLIQDPLYQSPWRIKFLGVAADEISGGVRFKLSKKYSGFLENLTFKILPKHIFQDIAPQNWPRLISKEYLVGSGPFVLKEIMEDKGGYIKGMTFQRNNNYYGKAPYLEKITFVFYKTPEDLLKAAKLDEVQGLTPTDSKAFEAATKNNFVTNLISIPWYFALFFNTKEKTVFSDKEMRQALGLAVDKEKLIKDIFAAGRPAVSPILPDFFNFNEPAELFQYNKSEAERILENKGFHLNEATQKREKNLVKETSFKFTRNLTLESQGKDVEELQKCLANPPAGGKEIYPEGVVSGNFGIKTKVAVIKFQEKYSKDILAPAGLEKGNGEVKTLTREKLNGVCFEKQVEIIPLKLTITTTDKFPLSEIAQFLKKSWEEIGVEVAINKVSLSGLQTDILANRKFETLLFGEALSSIPDPFPFWHSSQKDHPGLNISSYESKKSDELLEKAREAQTPEAKKENMEKFQEVFLEDLPAIFLVRPDYTYMLSPAVKGYNVEKITEPSKRFSTIEQWYIKTKRVWR